ncbi:hypothetical protein GN316_08220 [Xylophilus sp. Kf1]|nr:hypothetical protein [Xylophilus sp. Kf1]
MKKPSFVSRTVAALLAAAFGCGVCQAQGEPAVPFDPAKSTTVLLGDSITFGGWWANTFRGQNMVNKGIPGDGTEGMLGRLGPVLGAKPNKILVLAGINDLLRGRTPQEVATTYRQLLTELSGAGGAKVYVQSTFHVAPPMPLAINDKVTTLNTAMRQFCEQSRRCTYIDLNFVLAPSGQLQPGFTVDGLHLNQAGYEAWFAQLKGMQLLN